MQAKAAAAGLPIASHALPSWPRRVTGDLAGSLFAVLFPSDCRVCSEPLVRISRLPVCQRCLDAMRPIGAGVCSVCGGRLFSAHELSSSEGVTKCGLCRRIEPPFTRAVAFGSDQGGLREPIHLLKYAGVRPAANVLGRMLAEVIAQFENELAADFVAVVPVPLHRAQLREREFNHADLIACAAIKLAPASARLRRCAEVLGRKRETASQTGLTSHQRRENVRGAFGMVHPETVRGREMLVVAGVYTTGSAVSECARVLRRAGATKVWVATVARTLKASQNHVPIELPDEGEQRRSVRGGRNFIGSGGGQLRCGSEVGAARTGKMSASIAASYL
jgi:ComF family protein